MRVMLLAFAAIILIAVIADLGLDRIGFATQDRNSSQAVRLD